LATPFISPTNPGESITIPRNTSKAEITQLNRSHDKATALFRQYNAADKALKQQIVGAVEAMFLLPLRSKYVGYQNSSTRDFLDHLYATYANISASDLLSNNEQMKANYDANQPIELFFDQIEDSVNFAAAGNCPYTPAQVTAIAYELVFKTGIFHDECKLLKRRIAADKNWADFKTVSSLAHQELRESQLTSSDIGFHSANAANAATNLQFETAEAIANLAAPKIPADVSRALPTTTPSTHSMLSCEHANNVHEMHTQSDLVAYLHWACFSPIKATWLKAINASYFATWPGLTAQLVTKHLPKSIATAKGHL
jgi:hypothetical protein